MHGTHSEPAGTPGTETSGHDHHGHHDHHHRPLTGLYGLVAGLSMLGQSGRARQVADLAQISPGDRVLDVGCGPGTGVRLAASRGATVTGIDPSAVMLRLARVTTRKAQGRTTFLEGTAESLPLPADSVDVAWAVASAHHWEDHAAALHELHRVLVSGGRLIIAERLVKEGAKGLAAHGASAAAGAQLIRHAEDAGFVEARTETLGHGAHSLLAVTATNGA